MVVTLELPLFATSRWPRRLGLVLRLERNTVGTTRRREGEKPTRRVLPFREFNAFVSDDYCFLRARADDAIDIVIAVFDRRELSLQGSLLAIGHLKKGCKAWPDPRC